jgi:hypothetical protein
VVEDQCYYGAAWAGRCEPITAATISPWLDLIVGVAMAVNLDAARQVYSAALGDTG